MSTCLLCLLTLSCLLLYVMSQEIIWQSLMASSDYTNWTINGLNTQQLHTTSGECPDYGNNGGCWLLCGNENNNQDDDYIDRIASTEGYEDIYLIYNLHALDKATTGQYCKILYSIDNSNTNWNEFNPALQFKDSIRIKNATVSLDASARNNIGVGIKILTFDEDCCYIEDFALMGTIMIPTSNPTTNPTTNPTVNPTTDTPTNTPTYTPTTNAPTTFLPTTSPSNSPSTDRPTTNNPTTNIPTIATTSYPSVIDKLDLDIDGSVIETTIYITDIPISSTSIKNVNKYDFLRFDFVMIAISGILVILVIIIFVLLIMYYQKKQKKKKKNTQEIELNTINIYTIDGNTKYAKYGGVNHEKHVQSIRIQNEMDDESDESAEEMYKKHVHENSIIITEGITPQNIQNTDKCMTDSESDNGIKSVGMTSKGNVKSKNNDKLHGNDV